MLDVLVSDNQGVCVDNRAWGRPLMTFTTIMAAPAASGSGVAWRTPGTLRGQGELSNRQLYRDSLGGQRAHLQEPQNNARPLPAKTQRQIDAIAHSLSAAPAQGHVYISSGWNPPGVLTR